MRKSLSCRVVRLLASPMPATLMLATLMLTTGARAAGCVQADISRATAAVQDARAVLMELPVQKPGDVTTAIAAPVQDGIVAMKARLADFILAYMRCQPENVDVNGITVDLSRLGWAQSLEGGRGRGSDEPPPLSAHAGWALSFEARAPAQGLIGITASFGVPCGGDTELLLFEHRDSGWAEVMRVAAKPYRDVTQAYWAFDYAISPSDATDGWYLAEKHLPNTCIAFFSGITYSAQRASGNALKPRILFTGHDTLYSAKEDYGSLAVDADGFEIRFHDVVDSDLKAIVRRFSVTGNAVRPVGQNPP